MDDESLIDSNEVSFHITCLKFVLPIAIQRDFDQWIAIVWERVESDESDSVAKTRSSNHTVFYRRQEIRLRLFPGSAFEFTRLFLHPF